MPVGVADGFRTEAERADDHEDVFHIHHDEISFGTIIAAAGCRRDLKIGGLPGNAVAGGDAARLGFVVVIAASLRARLGAARLRGWLVRLRLR